MQLSNLSIHGLCDPLVRDSVKAANWLRHPRTGECLPMISPFSSERVVVSGKSWGLSGASYDVRIAHDLVLPPAPGYAVQEALRTALRAADLAEGQEGEWRAFRARLWAILRDEGKPNFALAHTVEDFAIPLNVSGYACDKSTYARMGISCFNTLFDPGFIGNATLELVNLSPHEVVVRSGDPICQFVFHWLDKQTGRAYAGKYQFQPKQAVPAILEGTGEDGKDLT